MCNIYTMASDVARAFHNQTSLINRQFLNDRINYGTKSSSPEVRNVKRLQPLNYFNPLPDNSSGSKIRPFQMTKDESGRPNAMELVAMRQAGDKQLLQGGVLKDYKYAKFVLNRRATDTKNIELAAKQLPVELSPLLEIDDIDKQKLILSQVISKIQDDLDTGDVTNLTYESMKTLSRSLIVLSSSFDAKDIANLSRIFDDMTETINSRVENQGLKTQLESTRSARGIQQYITKFINPFIETLAKAVDMPENAKRALITSSARQLFASVNTESPTPQNIIRFNNNIMVTTGENIADAIQPGINYTASKGSIKNQIESLAGTFREEVRGLQEPIGPRTLEMAYYIGTADAVRSYITFFSGKNGYEDFLRKLKKDPYNFKQLFLDYIKNKTIPALNRISTDKESERVYEAFQKKVESKLPEVPDNIEFTGEIPRIRIRPRVAPEAAVPQDLASAEAQAEVPAEAQAQEQVQEQAPVEGFAEYTEADYAPEVFSQYLSAGDAVSEINNETQQLRRELNFLIGKYSEIEGNATKMRQAFRRVAKNSPSTPGYNTKAQIKDGIQQYRNALGLAMYDAL